MKNDYLRTITYRNFKLSTMKFGNTGNFGLIMPDSEIVSLDKRTGKEFETELQALAFGKEVLDSMAAQLEVAKVKEAGVDFLR